MVSLLFNVRKDSQEKPGIGKTPREQKQKKKIREGKI